ncbi:hypothetical protein F2Q69_00015396 [Brassica cretica]|uniref:Uncharacterized protein n=1 Tax=Brassica cretica TaxID=69181 RepID=A0A8S9QJ23_BRACR|nr:hypothetical protein F2Q69_00015396 [Brassica cretica]
MEWINSKRNWKHDVKYLSMMRIEYGQAGKGCGWLRNDPIIMAGIINLSVQEGLKETEQSVRTHGRVRSLKIETCSLGLGWCIEWLGDVGETCIYDDQDVISEKEQGGRSNEMLGQLGVSSTQLDGVLEARTSVSVLGGYRAGWLAKDGYGLVGSSGQAMGMGNPCRLVLDISRSGLTVPRSLEIKARQGFLLNPETQRKPEQNRGFLYVLGTHSNGQERREKAGIHSQWHEQSRRRMQCRKWFHGSSMEGMMGATHEWILSILESIGSDLMALNQGLGRFRNDAHGLSRAVHGQDPYDPDPCVRLSDHMLVYCDMFVNDAPDVRARLIGSVGTRFHGRLSMCEDSSVLSHAVPKRKGGRLVGLARRASSYPASSSQAPYADPMILEELHDKDERIGALEEQNTTILSENATIRSENATILAELASQKKFNTEIMQKLDRLMSSSSS